MVSIIVPIYNVKKFLDDCIGSILGSDYRDLEVILVDDGSTDGSGDVCDQWAARDPRVVVIHQANAGIAGARNAGMARARGEYIMLADGDDVIDRQMVGALVTAIEDGDYDLAMVLGRNVTEAEAAALAQGKAEAPAAAPAKSLSQDDLLRGLFDLTTFQYQVVWNKLYRRALVEDVPFRQVASEDLEWNTRVYLKAHKAVFTAVELYYYVQHNASVMHQGFNRSALNRFDTVMECLDHIPEKNSVARTHCMVYLYKTFLYVRHKCEVKQVPFINEVKDFGKKLRAKTGRELWHSRLRLVDKLKIFGFYRCPWLYNQMIARTSK